MDFLNVKVSLKEFTKQIEDMGYVLFRKDMLEKWSQIVAELYTMKRDCYHCFKPLLDGWEFCPHCGKKYKAEEHQ